MANNDDDYMAAYGWTTKQTELVNKIGDIDLGVTGDDHALDLIDRAFFDMDISRGERDLARAEAAWYFDDEYGIDLFDVWDYEDYRAWYDAA